MEKQQRKRRWPQQPADAGVHHHVHMVMADVRSATSRSGGGHGHIATASAAAHQTVLLADRLLAYMQNAEQVETMSGARAARVRSSFAPLFEDPHGLTALPNLLGRFIAAHRASYDKDPDEVFLKIVAFIEWAKTRSRLLDERVGAFRAEYRCALQRDRERLRRTCDAWSVADGDGLS